MYLVLPYPLQLCGPPDRQRSTPQLSRTVYGHFPVLLSSPQLFISSSSSLAGNMAVQMGRCHPSLTLTHPESNVDVSAWSPGMVRCVSPINQTGLGGQLPEEGGHDTFTYGDRKKKEKKPVIHLIQLNM